MKYERTVSVDDLDRMKQMREEADRRYNEALTALDQSVQPRPEAYPLPPRTPDEHQVTPLNQYWEILAAAPPALPGWRGRLASFVWKLLFPLLERQQAFNSAVVDHVNRNVGPQRELAAALSDVIALQSRAIEAGIVFQHRMILFLQQVTSYIDTKDREFFSLQRRVAEDAMVTAFDLGESVERLTAALHALSDEILKNIETLRARDRRYDGRIDQLAGALTTLQQQAMALKREMERLRADGARPAVSGGPGGNVRVGETAGPDAAVPANAGAAVDAWKYVGFEDQFRGSQDDIRQRLEAYVPLFEGASDVLDVGCGRGEFLDLLRARGITCRGVDLNAEMVAVCRGRGLEAVESDALGYLRGLSDGALGGLIATQVVEHLPPDYLLQFLDEAQRVLRPGSVLVLETINVACWLAFFESYVRDVTHSRPLHPDTLRYLVQASGFADVDVRFSAPVAQENRLQPVPGMVRHSAEPVGHELTVLADTVDANTRRLNELLFTHLDYAVIAKRA